jgi:hypothetical protein
MNSTGYAKRETSKAGGSAGLLIIFIIIIFMDWAICGLFHPLQEYADLFTLTVGILYFVFFRVVC